MSQKTTPFDASYWQNRYQKDDTPWDIGYASPALVAYFNKLAKKNESNKKLNILIPGAGNAYEAEYLHQKGFENVFVVDLAASPLEDLSKRVPSFPKEGLVQSDFFALDEKFYNFFDIILEQTFFCALAPKQRGDYAEKMAQLLKEEGKLVGLLFDFPIQEEQESPPFGGSTIEYMEVFEPYFEIKTLKRCYNSIKPRQGTELFMELEKKAERS